MIALLPISPTAIALKNRNAIALSHITKRDRCQEQNRDRRLSPQRDRVRGATIQICNTHTGRTVRTLKSDRPYEGMNITGVTGISEGQKASLKALGAIKV